jgi:hypothetical protein
MPEPGRALARSWRRVAGALDFPDRGESGLEVIGLVQEGVQPLPAETPLRLLPAEPAGEDDGALAPVSRSRR